MSYFNRAKKAEVIHFAMKTGTSEGAVRAWLARSGQSVADAFRPNRPASTPKVRAETRARLKRKLPEA